MWECTGKKTWKEQRVLWTKNSSLICMFKWIIKFISSLASIPIASVPCCCYLRIIFATLILFTSPLVIYCSFWHAFEFADQVKIFTSNSSIYWPRTTYIYRPGTYIHTHWLHIYEAWVPLYFFSRAVSTFRFRPLKWSPHYIGLNMNS